VSYKTRGNWLLGECVRRLKGKPGGRKRCRWWNREDKCAECLGFKLYEPGGTTRIRSKRSAVSCIRLLKLKRKVER